jgi:hypothetical protein
LKRLLALAVVGLLVWAALAWPRINEVETGVTPGYESLRPHAYHTGEKQTLETVKTLVGRLPGWKYVGSGTGPGGSEVKAVRSGALGLRHEVTIRVRFEGGKSLVGVRSRSPALPWDFGRNARVIREFFAALDGELSR